MSIKLNIYQAQNVIGLLLRSHHHDTGDWYCELLDICLKTLHKHNIETIENNFGDKIPMDKFWDKWQETRTPK